MHTLVILVKDEENEASIVGEVLMDFVPRLGEIVYLSLSSEGESLPGTTTHPLNTAIFKVDEICYALFHIIQVEPWMYPYVDRHDVTVYIYLDPVNEETRLYTQRVIAQQHSTRGHQQLKEEAI